MTEDLQNIQRLADQLSLHDQQLLAAHLRRNLIFAPPRSPRSLKGLWKDSFPPDVDIEAAIREIRDEWKPELNEFAE